MIYKIPLRNKIFILSLLALIIVSTLFSGCGTRGSAGVKHYTRATANFQFIKKVAILPFNNLSDDKYAGEKIKNAIMIEILERGIFDVVELGEVNKVIADVFRELGFSEGELVSLDIETIQRISERLGTQALFIGTVESYGISRTSRTPHPVVSVSLRLVESKSGLTLWQAAHSKRGNSLLRSILGLDQKDEYMLSQEIAKQLLNTLFEG